MKIKLPLLLLLTLMACHSTDKPSAVASNANSNQKKSCDYIHFFKDLGNTKIDTFRLDNRLVDPIDDTIGFEKAAYGFLLKGENVYKKARTFRNCNGDPVEVAFYQDLRDRIELRTYKEYDDIFFTTKNKVYFWWVNSDGHLIFPINDANPVTFKPFEDMCGGIDDKAVYYGCPNHGVYQLDIPITSTFEFFPKPKNYWNSPKHYVVVDNRVYDINYKLDQGYHCELNQKVTLTDLKKQQERNNEK